MSGRGPHRARDADAGALAARELVRETAPAARARGRTAGPPPPLWRRSSAPRRPVSRRSGSAIASAAVKRGLMLSPASWNTTWMRARVGVAGETARRVGTRSRSRPAESQRCPRRDRAGARASAPASICRSRSRPPGPAPRRGPRCRLTSSTAWTRGTCGAGAGDMGQPGAGAGGKAPGQPRHLEQRRHAGIPAGQRDAPASTSPQTRPRVAQRSIAPLAPRGITAGREVGAAQIGQGAGDGLQIVQHAGAGGRGGEQAPLV